MLTFPVIWWREVSSLDLLQSVKEMDNHTLKIIPFDNTEHTRVPPVLIPSHSVYPSLGKPWNRSRNIIKPKSSVWNSSGKVSYYVGFICVTFHGRISNGTLSPNFICYCTSPEGVLDQICYYHLMVGLVSYKIALGARGSIWSSSVKNSTYETYVM